MNKEHQVIKQVLTLSSAKYLGEFFLAIRGLIIASVLGPSLYGIWSIFKTFFEISQYTSLGGAQSMMRQIPFFSSQKKFDQANATEHNAFGIAFSVSALVTFGFFVFAAFIPSYRTELLLGGLVFICCTLHWHLTNKLKAVQKITILSIYEFIYAILNTILGIWLVLYLGIKGLLIGMVLAYGLSIFIVYRKKLVDFHISLNKTVIKQIILLGGPFMILSLTVFFMNNIDKLVVFILLGSTQTGYYSLAAFLSTIILYLPFIMTSVLLPKMSHKFGRTKNKKTLLQYFDQPHEILMLVLSIVLGLLFIFVDLVTQYILPQYQPALPVLRILLFGLYFAALMPLSLNIMVTLNQHHQLIKPIISVLGIGLILDIIIILLGGGIQGVAFMTALTFFLGFSIYSLACLKSLNAPKRFRKYVFVLFPFAYMSLAIFITISIPSSDVIWVKDIMQTIIYLALMLPLVIIFESRNLVFTKTLSSLLKPKANNTLAIISPKFYPALQKQSTITFGGAEVALTYFAKELAKSKEVHVLTGDYQQDSTISIDNMILHKTFSKNTITSSLKLLGHLRKIKPGVCIQRSLTIQSSVLSLYCLLTRKKFVYMIAHDNETDGGHPLYQSWIGRFFVKLLFTTANHVVAQNDYEYQKIRESYQHTKVTIIKKGVTPLEVQTKKTYDGVWLARCDTWKHPERFIELAKANKDKKFLMICPPANNKIRYYNTIKNSIPSNITFYDFIPQAKIKRILSKAKVNCFTSSQEGDWPMSVLEACSVGIPTVSYEANYGLLISQYKGGILAKNTLESFNKAFNIAHKKHINMGKKALKYLTDNHNIQKQAEMLKQIL